MTNITNTRGARRKGNCMKNYKIQCSKISNPLSVHKCKHIQILYATHARQNG